MPRHSDKHRDKAIVGLQAYPHFEDGSAWFRDRETELDKAEEAWRKAVDASDNDEPPQGVDAAPGILPSNTLPQRGPRPHVPRKGAYGYDSIADFHCWQLADLRRWIESDTLLRTYDDLIREIMNELGIKKSGKRIRDALITAIRDARRYK